MVQTCLCQHKLTEDLKGAGLDVVDTVAGPPSGLRVVAVGLAAGNAAAAKSWRCFALASGLKRSSIRSLTLASLLLGEPCF